MANFTIQSRNFGEVTFACRDEGGYVRVYGADIGTRDGKQPCEGGGFTGNTLTANEKTLEKMARRWWRQFLAGQREFA